MKKISIILMMLIFFTQMSSETFAQQVPFVFSINRLPSNNTKYESFYNFLHREGYPNSMLGTISDFTKKIKIRSHATRLYKGLRKGGYTEATLGTEAEFLKKFCE